MEGADRVPETMQLQSEINEISGKDLQLWSIGLLVLVVVAIGFIAVLVPTIFWKQTQPSSEAQYFPQLFWGFIIIIGLFNLYVFDQKRRLHVTREKLIRRMMNAGTEVGEQQFIDPGTKLFTRRYLELALERETKRAVRQLSPLTVLSVEIAGFRDFIDRFGAVAADHAVLVIAELVKRTFRGSDIAGRKDGSHFVVILPDTTEQQGQRAASRLRQAVAEWNATTGYAYKLGLVIRVTGCSDGTAPAAKLDVSEQGPAVLMRCLANREY